MTQPSVAQTSHELTQQKGGLALPEGVTGKIFTVYRDGKPYQTAIVLPDGSELTLGSRGEVFHTGAGEWVAEPIEEPKSRY